MSSRCDLAGLTEALARRRTRADEDVPATRKAAVAAVFREVEGGVELLFIRRAEHPRDPWSGQMGLPGGRVDPGDASPLAAALRETREEIGLDLEALGRPLGRLSEVRTHLPLGAVPHSVVPFAFAIEGDPELQPQRGGPGSPLGASPVPPRPGEPQLVSRGCARVSRSRCPATTFRGPRHLGPDAEDRRRARRGPRGPGDGPSAP